MKETAKSITKIHSHIVTIRGKSIYFFSRYNNRFLRRWLMVNRGTGAARRPKLDLFQAIPRIEEPTQLQRIATRGPGWLRIRRRPAHKLMHTIRRRVLVLQNTRVTPITTVKHPTYLLNFRVQFKDNLLAFP